MLKRKVSAPQRGEEMATPTIRVRSIHRKLGKHCYMALRGWVSLQRLFIEHSRALGLKMSDFLAITCILNEQEKYGYGTEGDGANFTKIATYAPISARDLTECVKRLERLQLVAIWRRPGKPSLFNFAPLYERCWEYLTEEERAEAEAIWAAIEAERKPQPRKAVQPAMAGHAASAKNKERVHLAPPAEASPPDEAPQTPSEDEAFWQQASGPITEPTLDETLDGIAQLLGERDTDREGSLRRIRAAQALAGWSDSERDACLDLAAEQARKRATRRRQGFFLRDFEGRAFDAYDQAARAAAVQAEQEREWAAILAIPLSDKALRCEMLLREQGWPCLHIPGVRLFSGERDWLWLLHLTQDETLLDEVLAQLAPNLPGISSEQELEVAALIDQTGAAAPLHQAMPPPCAAEQGSILSVEGEQEHSAPICEELTMMRFPQRPTEPRYWLEAESLGFPRIEYLADDDTWQTIEGIEAWQHFRQNSSRDEQDRAKIALQQLRRRCTSVL
jgi:hypothetical protein